MSFKYCSLSITDSMSFKIKIPFFVGTSGAEVTHVFCSSGEDVRLSCNNALSGCTSTTWSYIRHSEAVELIAGGIKKNNTERHERLSLGSNCSLNIKKVTKEDCGLYVCRQYVNEEQQGADARVYLHVLHGQCFCEYYDYMLN